MFNTGDLCRWLPDGSIAHEGRADDQVKIKVRKKKTEITDKPLTIKQGFRVELDSVSASMEAAPGVSKACAIFNENVLWGFYSGPSKTDEADVKAIVESRLPYYAVPSKLCFREHLPMTSNGKINKIALLASVSGSLSPLSPPQVSKPLPAVVPSEKQEMEVFVTQMPTVNSKESSASSDSDYLERFVLPPKKGKHGFRAFRHRIFSLYRRIFSVVVIGNLITLFLMLIFGKTGRGLQNISTAVAANLLMAVLMRQEHVINALFSIATAIPTSTPMWIRRNAAKVYHIGGLHSGCAVASTVWFVIFTIATTLHDPHPAILAISYMIVVLMISIIGFAHPNMRQRYHDRFELIHRFAGWSALALFWAQIVVVANSRRGAQPLGSALIQSPGFWLLVIATSSIILPWLNLRKVSVRSEVLSNHAVRLHFTYQKPPIVGTAIRLSERPLIEWHAFATIAKPNEKEFSVLVSNAGDWTNRQIQTAPTKLWVKGVPACGVLRIAPLFKSLVLVATGSGIGPCLPVIYAAKIPLRIFWSTPHPEQNFGPEIIEAIYKADPNAVIWNTKTMGRPDMVQSTYSIMKESNAEAIAIISNKKLTQMVVYAMESRGLPAFGAIFDS